MVEGRLELALIADTHKHPILLPAKDVAVVNYVRKLPFRNYHAASRGGTDAVLVLNCDRLRRIVRNCVHCVQVLVAATSYWQPPS